MEVDRDAEVLGVLEDRSAAPGAPPLSRPVGPPPLRRHTPTYDRQVLAPGYYSRERIE